MAINPMQGPIDYLGQMGITPQSPTQALLEGLQLGAVFQEQRKARELEQKNARFQADMSAWRSNPTDDRLVELLNMYPEFGEGIRSEWKFLDDKTKDAEYTEAMQTYLSLKSQNPQVGLDRLDQRIAAEKEAGQDVSGLENIRRAFGSGTPEEISGALPSLALQIAAMDPERWKKFNEAALAATNAQVAESTGGAQVSKVKADAALAEIRAKYEPQLLRTQIDQNIAALVASGVNVGQAKVEATQKSEADLRAEYWNATKDYRNVRTSYEKVAQTLDTPAGDQALIYNFMKMLDPNSAVLPGEYATAQNAGGVPTRIVAAYNKAVDGTLLKPETRADYRAQAERILRTYEKDEKIIRNGISGIANKSGLNLENIFYETSPQYLSAPPQGSAEQSQSEGGANTPDLDAAMRQHGGR